MKFLSLSLLFFLISLSNGFIFPTQRSLLTSSRSKTFSLFDGKTSQLPKKAISLKELTFPFESGPDALNLLQTINSLKSSQHMLSTFHSSSGHILSGSDSSSLPHLTEKKDHPIASLLVQKGQLRLGVDDSRDLGHSKSKGYDSTKFAQISIQLQSMVDNSRAAVLPVSEAYPTSHYPLTPNKLKENDRDLFVALLKEGYTVGVVPVRCDIERSNKGVHSDAYLFDFPLVVYKAKQKEDGSSSSSDDAEYGSVFIDLLDKLPRSIQPVFYSTEKESKTQLFKWEEDDESASHTEFLIGAFLILKSFK
jgi:hypothetical protein